jgi:hypothetical protein
MLHWNDTPPAEAHGLEFVGAGELGKADLHTAQAFEALWAGLTCVVNGAWRSDGWRGNARLRVQERPAAAATRSRPRLMGGRRGLIGTGAVSAFADSPDW